MIRWARRADAGTLGEWEADWTQRWRCKGQNVRVFAAFPVELEDRLAVFAAGPGTRLLLTLTHRIGEDANLLSILDRAGWAPEMPHRCDPLPGDPRATLAWREREGILIESMETRVGAILVKRLRPDDLERMRFVALVSSLEPGHLPLPTDGRLPFPGGLIQGPFRVDDFVSAFGVTPRDALPLLDEMIACGALLIA